MGENKDDEKSFYPSAKVRLTVRFDEYAVDKVRKQIAPGTKETKDLRGNPAPRGKLRVIPDPESPPSVTRFLVTDGNGGTQQQGGGTARASSPDDLTFRIEGVIPHSASIDRNSFRKPDEAKVEIRYIDLPFDPRVMRAVAIDIFMGTVTPGEWAAGVAGELRSNFGGKQTEPLNVIADTWLDKNQNQRTNLRFEGWVDLYEMSLTGDSDQLVTLNCKDSTWLLGMIDAPSGATIDKNKPVDEAIAEYLSQFPSLNGLSVEYRPGGVRDQETPPRMAKVLSGTAFQPQIGPAPAKGGGSTGGDNLNVWDYLTDIAGAIGHTVRVEGRLIIIQRLRDILNGKAAPRTDDPYRTRNLDSRRYENRAMIYGRNIKSLKVRKEFGKKVPTNIQINCYNPRRKKILTARFPEDKDKAAIQVRPGADSNDKKWTVIPGPPGVEDEKVLKMIAEDVYNSLGRNEVQVEIETADLCSFGGDNDDPDLLDMIYGDTIEVLMNHDEDYNTQTQIAAQQAIFEKNRQMMLKLGYDDDTAEGYAKAFTDANFQRLFRVKEVKLDWSTEEGISINMEVANYIEARADAPADDGPKPATNSAVAKKDSDRKKAAIKQSEFDKKFTAPGQKEIAPGVFVNKK